MVEAFEAINLGVFDDVLRIKKPSLQALNAAQMMCKLVTSFRGGSSKINLDALFLSWRDITDFISKKQNITKFNQEITQLIQHMILSPEYLKQLKSNQLKNHISKLTKIQSQYFGMDTFNQIQTHYLSSRSNLALVRLTFTVVRYVLFQSGNLQSINMLAPRTKLEVKNMIESKSNTSFTSGYMQENGNYTRRTPRRVQGALTPVSRELSQNNTQKSEQSFLRKGSVKDFNNIPSSFDNQPTKTEGQEKIFSTTDCHNANVQKVFETV